MQNRVNLSELPVNSNYELLNRFTFPKLITFHGHKVCRICEGVP